MNVIFKTIKINNFLSLGNAVIELDDQGFVLVKGVNKESEKTQSNGSGKSSIFDAILWTITGDTLRGTSEVVNEFSGKEGCTCELEFQVDEVSYRIVRYKGHPEYKNSCYFYENDELVSDQTKKSQEMINNRIPVISSEILGSIVLLGQGLPYKFSALTPINRKNLLETMSGSASQIEHLKYQLDIEASEVNQKLSNLNLISTHLESEIGSNEKLVYHLNQMKSRSIEDIDSEINIINQEISETQDAISQIENELPKKQEQYDQLKTINNQILTYIGQLSYERNIITDELNQIGNGICPTCGRPYDNYSEVQAKVQEYQNELNKNSETKSVLETKLTTIQIQVKEALNIVNNLVGTKQANEYLINNKIDDINRLEEEKSRTSETDDKIKLAEEEIKQATVKRYDVSKEIEALTEKSTTVAYLIRQTSRDFKGYLLSEVISYLSNRSEYYGNYLFKDHKVNVRLQGNKVLISVDDRLYENLSGGERQRVDLAVQFALRDMLVMTTGFSCNLLVLDEAFDNLDMKGSNDLIDLISSEFSDIDSVFTVTHHSDISIPYDNTLVVVKDSSGVSSVISEV